MLHPVRFTRGEQAVVEAVQQMFPNLELQVNHDKPRRNAFNLTLNGVEVWNGHPMGPPRALKFDILVGTRLHDEIVKSDAQQE